VKKRLPKHIVEAMRILSLLGLPRAQQNKRSALCVLALLNLTPRKKWMRAESPLMGITPIMKWAREHYGEEYAPNTRETFRRQTLHQFVDAAVALYNPDNPNRPLNSPKAVYQIEPATLELLRGFGTKGWDDNLTDYLSRRESLVAQYALERKQNQIPVRIAENKEIKLSPGQHSKLIRSVIEEFGPRFAPDSILVYAGDTGEKWAHFDKPQLAKLGIGIGSHGKMTDVVLYDTSRDWLFLVEAVTSHGPVDGKRHAELTRLFSRAEGRMIYVTAFPSRSVMAMHIGDIAWETEVWVAEAPSHLIHFDGERFLGPYPST